jgi:hypothetical protein
MRPAAPSLSTSLLWILRADLALGSLLSSPCPHGTSHCPSACNSLAPSSPLSILFHPLPYSSCVACREWTKHEALRLWVNKQVGLCKPDRVHLLDGSESENEALLKTLVHAGTLIPAGEKWPGCYLARSTTADVARVESRTYICSERTYIHTIIRLLDV